MNLKGFFRRLKQKITIEEKQERSELASLSAEIETLRADFRAMIVEIRHLKEIRMGIIRAKYLNGD